MNNDRSQVGSAGIHNKNNACVFYLDGGNHTANGHQEESRDLSGFYGGSLKKPHRKQQQQERAAATEHSNLAERVGSWSNLQEQNMFILNSGVSGNCYSIGALYLKHLNSFQMNMII